MKETATKIKYALEHSSVFKGLVPVARKLGIVHFLHVMYEKTEGQETADKKEAFQRFYESHIEEFAKLKEILEDDFSRLTLEKVLEYRRTRKMSSLKGIITQPQYFQKDIFSPMKDEVFIDGGAYTGDTIESFIKNWGGVYKAIYAWEPDAANIKQMKKNLRGFKNIKVIPFGMWKEKGSLGFDQHGGSVSKIDEGLSDKVEVESIDHICFEEKVTFIKMDIEGSEKEALEGAVNVIKRDRPRLAICIYHSPEDLYEIPFWIKSIVPEYKLYIRHHSDGAAETVVYATV